MSPEGKRKFNTITGSSFILLGGLAWGLATYFVLTPAPKRPHPVLAAPLIDVASCIATLNRMGMQPVSLPNALSVNLPSLDNPERQLEKVSLAITACKFPLKTFCMGEACERTGISFVLDTKQEEADLRSSGTQTGASSGQPGRPTSPAGVPRPSSK